MTTRYIVDSEGQPVEAVLGMEEYRALLDTHARLEEAIEGFRETVEVMSASGYPEYQEAMKRLEDAQRALSEVTSGLDNLEDLEATRAHDADTELLETGDGETVPLREALPRLEAERAALERRGEL